MLLEGCLDPDVRPPPATSGTCNQNKTCEANESCTSCPADCSCCHVHSASSGDSGVTDAKLAEGKPDGKVALLYCDGGSTYLGVLHLVMESPVNDVADVEDLELSGEVLTSSPDGGSTSEGSFLLFAMDEAAAPQTWKRVGLWTREGGKSQKFDLKWALLTLANTTVFQLRGQPKARAKLDAVRSLHCQ